MLEMPQLRMEYDEMTPAEIEKLLAAATKGPWVAHQMENLFNIHQHGVPPGYQARIADVIYWDKNHTGSKNNPLIETAAANARLIAAAPDLARLALDLARELAAKDAQLDAANAKLALHESENVTRGLLIDELQAQLQTAQSSLTNARRTLPMRLWSDCGTSLASEVADVITLDQANAMVGAALREAAEAVPRGWCAPETSNTEMDVVLGQAIQNAILALAPDATAALDRALEQMRERCADHLRAQLEYLKSKGWSADYSFIAICEGTMRALPLHKDEKP